MTNEKLQVVKEQKIVELKTPETKFEVAAKAMRCPICATVGNFENVDKFRIKPENMCVCKTCGFITYPSKYKDKEKLIEFYKKDYRGRPPVVTSIFQGEKKCMYHDLFLRDILDKWKSDGRKITVTDVGCAFGMTLDWIKQLFKDQIELIYGVELTESYVRNAYHLFGISCRDDFDDSKLHDLIISYKSHEHILDPDIEMVRYLSSLKPDGYLYYSVPTWFDALENFGTAGFDLEYYYSPNHVNVWTRKQVEAMIKFCGGEIVRENHTIYGNTYLIKRVSKPTLDKRSAAFEDFNEIKEKLNKIFSAFEAYQVHDFDSALTIWPNFPSAHRGRYEFRRADYDKQGFDWIYENIVKTALKSCPNKIEAEHLAADICMRYSKFDLAVKHLEASNLLTPNNPTTFSMLANCFAAMANQATDEAEKINFLKQAKRCVELMKETNRGAFQESVNLIMMYNSKLPIDTMIFN